MNDSLLVNLVADTTSGRDRDELDLAITRLLAQFLSANSSSLFRLTDVGSTKRVVRRATVDSTNGEQGATFTGNPFELPALADFPALMECASRGDIVRSGPTHGDVTTIFPLVTGAEVIGMLSVETASALDPRDLDLVRGILRILQNHLALLEYGERDTLTGLLNRKTFEGFFSKRTQPAAQHRERRVAPAGEPSWLALMDIDKFKSVNDTFGHLFGDEVLLLCSQLMKHNFRGADQLFRFGGEEFLIVLDHASEVGANIALERLRGAVEAYPFPQIGKVTVSIGYTQIVPHDVSTLCVERADAALYYAKANGRNRVCHYEVLVERGDLVPKSENSEMELF